MRTKQKSRPKASLLAKVLIVVMLVAIGWQLYRLQGQIAQAEADKDRYAQQVEQQEQENAALASDLEEGPTSEKLEEIARDKLGLVKPGEYVFEPGS